MTSEFFSGNRKALIESIEGGVVLMTAYTSLQRSNDASFKFEQEANFWYLSGISDPDWLLIIDGSSNQAYLVMPDIDDVHRTFDGGISADEARKVSGITKILTNDEGQELIRQLAKRHTVVHTVGIPPYAEHFNFSLNPAPGRHWAMLERNFKQVQDCRKNLNQLRAIKQPEEILAVQKAVNATVAAFKNIHGNFQKYKNEYEIEADFSRDIRFQGATGTAYDSIVASGVNACTLHYNANSTQIKSKQLVLMDMGAQYGGYAADITRTYAKGEPTKRQKDVHAAVEGAHLRIIDLLEPMLSVEEYQRSVERIMGETLENLGFSNNEETLRRYFPHAISHGLGIDVHDSLGSPKYFQENMVLTVEPGIYIPEERIGVRIEDDILITKSGRHNLSSALSTGM